ncbi:hypothetical protein ACFL4O_00680 [bacterium]
MKHAITVGFNFGATSGIITTLGLMIGLNSSTQSRLAVIGGILTIAIADAFSDALGIHISEESENVHTAQQIWLATFCTFFSKLIMALTFVVPVLLFNLITAVKIGVVWGTLILALMSLKIAKSQKAKPWPVILEHLLIMFLVIILAHYTGELIAVMFKA